LEDKKIVERELEFLGLHQPQPSGAKQGRNPLDLESMVLLTTHPIK
jgi:hypothetical protein